MAAVGWTLTGEIAQRGVVLPAFSDIFPRHQIQTEDLLHESYVIFVLHFSEDQRRDHAWGKSQIRITALKQECGLAERLFLAQMLIHLHGHPFELRKPDEMSARIYFQ